MNQHNFKIEKGVPIPDRKQGGVSRGYPFDEMQIGDSFVIDRPINRVGGSLAVASKKNGHIYSSRKIDETSCRVWRVA